MSFNIFLASCAVRKQVWNYHKILKNNKNEKNTTNNTKIDINNNNLVLLAFKRCSPAWFLGFFLLLRFSSLPHSSPFSLLLLKGFSLFQGRSPLYKYRLGMGSVLSKCDKERAKENFLPSLCAQNFQFGIEWVKEIWIHHVMWYNSEFAFIWRWI